MSSRSESGQTRKQLEEYTPQPQPYFTHTGSAWKPIDSGQQQLASAPASPVTSLRLATWNIDFSTPCPQARMASALTYLQTLVGCTPASTAVILCLQELKQDIPMPSERDDADLVDRAIRAPTSPAADDLGQIAAAPWVRDRFHLSDLTTSYWRCAYNSVTLVDKRLAILQVARLPFVSVFRREALLVDIALKPASGTSPAGNAEASILRICNVHLDSLGDESRLRPVQWIACAKYLQDKEGGVVAWILLGDCNANNTSDETIPLENGFRDANLELGGEENDPKGSPLRLNKLEKFAVGLRVEDDAARRALTEERPGLDFVTDHYGLMADFEIGTSWTL
ncbi:unnamed protein product [Discula destructiva]